MLTCFMVHACGHTYMKLVLINVCVSFNTGYVEEGKGDRERQTEERERGRHGLVHDSNEIFMYSIGVLLFMLVCPCVSVFTN